MEERGITIKNNYMSEEKENVRIASVRESKENELIDEFLRAKLSDLLNHRSTLMQKRRKEQPGMSVKQIQREMKGSLNMKKAIKDIELEWFLFCMKPKKRGVMGITSWKKVTPNREAFRVNAEHLMSQFDENEMKMFKEKGAINLKHPWYKAIFIYIKELFTNGNK